MHNFFAFPSQKLLNKNKEKVLKGVCLIMAEGLWVKKLINIIFFIVMVLASIPAVIYGDSERYSYDIHQKNDLLHKGCELDFNKIPIYFIPTQDRDSERMSYYVRTRQYTMWISQEGILYDFAWAHKSEINPTQPDVNMGYSEQSLKNTGKMEPYDDVVTCRFIEINQDCEIIPVDKGDYRVNYLIGNKKSEWRTNIPTSESVLYRNLYENIDLRLYGNEKQIEYDFIVKPGGKIDDIKFEYLNANRTIIDDSGNLVITTSNGEKVHKKPRCYKIIKNRMVDVSSSYVILNENVFGFKNGEYDSRYELIIDPIVMLKFSTYWGGPEMYTET